MNIIEQSNETRKLGDIASFMNGYAFKPEDWSDTGVPIIRIQDLTGSSYQANRYSGTYDKRYEVNSGDILISWSASLGIYVWVGEKAVLNQHIFKVIFDKENVNKSFFIHQVRHILENASGQAHGATMKHLTRPVFNALPFRLPDAVKQKEIADILDSISNMIELRQKILSKLDQLAKSRFIEMFGDGKYACQKASEICSEIVDCPHSTPSYSGNPLIYPAIRTSEIEDGEIQWTTMKYVAEDEYLFRTKRLIPQAGDIVYAREGTYGDCVVLPETHHFCLGQRTMLFRPDQQKCTSEYLHFALRSPDVKRQADESNAGSTVPHVNVADAKNFLIPLPPLALQSEFAAFIEQLDKSKLAKVEVAA